MIQWLNAAGVLAALALSLSLPVVLVERATGTGSATFQPKPLSRPVTERLPGNQLAVRDASGRAVPIARYARIASASTASDALLLELVEPTRIVAFTEYGAEHSWQAYRYAGKPTIAAVDDLERVLSLKPDLVVLSSPGAISKVARLEEAGLVVFDLGPQSGVDAFVDGARRLGAVLGVAERAEGFATSFRQRLEHLRAAVPPDRRLHAMYVAVYGGKLVSAGRGTSYHDVLTYAGLVDVGSRLFAGHPELRAEQLLDQDPELIVSSTGMRDALCGSGALHRLRACRSHGIVEVDGALLGDSGVGMLPAAERIHAGAYGGRRR